MGFGAVTLVFSLVLSGVSSAPAVPLCRGAFDLYFVLDSSGSVSKSNFQVQTVNFVQNITEFFISPKLRISLISFATTATTELELTGDRDRIKAGMEKLKKKIPIGSTFLHLGLQQAIEQARRLGGMSASVIIILTDGKLNQHRQKAIDAANEARSDGATVYAVGVDDYQKSDLEAIADSPAKDYVFTADNYASLQNLVASIVEKTCIEILSAEPSYVCAGEKYQVSLTGNGFTKTDNISKVICKFQINSTESRVTRPIKVTPRHLSCPAPEIERPGSSVILQVSVNGRTFVSSNVTVTSRDCVVSTTEKQSQKIDAKAILIFFLIALIVSLILVWWFWKLLPCAKPERDSPIIKDPEAKKKWPTVDASFYGGGGVGGVKPVRVNWGDKGATEAGNKLSKPEDAKVIEVSSLHGEEVKGPSCLSQVKMKFAAIGSVFQRGYSHVASYRPIKGGKSKLYAPRQDSYERARSALSSTSSQNA